MKTGLVASPGGSDKPSDFLYGIHVVSEALSARSGSVLKVLVARETRQLGKIIGLARSRHIPVSVEAPERLDRLVSHGNHQGVVALVASKSYADQEALLLYARQQETPPFLLLLDGIEDPQNFGAVLRTAAAAGIHGVFIPNRRAVGLTPGVAKASAGAMEQVQVARTTNIGKLIERLGRVQIPSYAFSLEATTIYSDLDYRGPVALVFGSEGKGIRPGVLRKCEQKASIPMGGGVQSLNISAAAAIVLFEAVRQRRGTQRKGPAI